MTAIQLLAIGFGLVMLFLTYTAAERNSLRVPEAAGWAVIWIALVLVSLLPDRLRGVVAPLQVARLLDLVVIATVMMLCVLLFFMHRAVRRLSDRVEALVRRLAIDRAEP